MQASKVLPAILAALLTAGFATAYAAGDQSTPSGDRQQQETPKDCKKNPNDPRCTDDDKKKN